jgi:limonene-1,2-epoxide hydrolase
VKITSFLSDKCIYRATETAAPVVGREAIAERVKGPVTRAEKVEFEILDTWAKGPLVVDDRLDYFISGGQTRIFHAVGVFYMVDGKIAEWTDFVIRDR